MTSPMRTLQPWETDMTAVTLTQRYYDIRDRHKSIAATGWYDELYALVGRCNGVVNRAQRIQDVLGPAQWVEHKPAGQWLPGGVFSVPPNTSGRGDAEGTFYTREPVQATPYALQAIQTAQSMRDDLATHENDYAAIIDLALKQCGPDRGAMLTDDKIADTKNDILTSLAGLHDMLRNQAAQRILNQAIADNNNTILYTMLSGPLDTVWLGFGDVSVKTLQRIYAQKTAAKAAQDGRTAPPAVAFVALQDGDYKLENMVPAALAVFDYFMSLTKALIKR